MRVSSGRHDNLSDGLSDDPNHLPAASERQLSPAQKHARVREAADGRRDTAWQLFAFTESPQDDSCRGQFDLFASVQSIARRASAITLGSLVVMLLLRCERSTGVRRSQSTGDAVGNPLSGRRTGMLDTDRLKGPCTRQTIEVLARSNTPPSLRPTHQAIGQRPTKRAITLCSGYVPSIGAGAVREVQNRAYGGATSMLAPLSLSPATA
jgi:hypothetical protein